MGFLNRLKNTIFTTEEARLRAEEEAHFHLEMREQELMDQGFSPSDAVRKARESYGNVLRQQEQASDSDLLGGLHQHVRDVKVSYRRLRRSPLFLVSGVALLAVGLGVNAAVFSVVDTLFLRGLPFTDAGSLVVLKEFRANKPSNSNPMRIADWRTRVRAFEAVASYYGEDTQLREKEGNRPIVAMRIVGDWVRLLGAKPLAGRLFEAAELRGAKVALLTAKGRQLARVGDRIRVGADSLVVIGVVDNSVALGEDVQLITPISEGLLNGSRKAGYLQVVARLKPGIGIASAEAEAVSVAEQLAREYPDTDKGTTVKIVSAQEAWTEEARKPALWIQAASGLLLLITLVTLAGLFASRALERRREDSVRLFLGAGRWHLIRLHLVESGLLVSLGCAAALLVAPWSLTLLQLNYGDDFTPIKSAVINLRVFVFLLLSGFFSALLLASVMAWQSTREKDPRGQAQFRLRNFLIVFEAALGLVLIACAFQLVGDFSALRFAPNGFREQGLLSARVDLTWEAERKDVLNLIRRGTEEIGALPGVSGVAVVDRLPLEGGSQDSTLFIQGLGEKTLESVGLRLATNNYFGLMAIPLLVGELPKDENSILINDAFSSRYLDNNPIGRNISSDGKKWYRVAGVVANVRYSTRDAKPRPEVFFSERQQFWPLLTFVIQSSQPATNLSTALRKIWSNINPDANFKGVTTLENRIDEIVTQPRRQRDIFAIFGVIALLLVIAGVYGIMSSEMHRRRREMGIRIAIGATRTHVIRIALERAAWLAIAACSVGSLLVFSLLHHWVEPDAIVIGAATVVAGMFAAAFIPAWRSSKTDPIMALRQD